MIRTHTPFKRGLALLMALVLSFSLIPFVGSLSTQAAAQSTGSSVADPSTLGQWKGWFSPLDNRYSGGVFLDKSVFTASDALSDPYFSDIRNKLTFGTDNFGNENFLVALSALGSNTEIKGHAFTPTDTVIVLDASRSMGDGEDTSIDDMVDGANDAIRSLISMNNYNRVAVIVYNSDASVLLPLDSYRAENAEGNLLAFARVRGSNYVTVAPNVYDSNGDLVVASSLPQSSGTYTQGGIWAAADMLLDSDPVIPSDKIQGDTVRIPIVVLMSDGEPTLRTQTSSYGHGHNAIDLVDRYTAASNANATSHISMDHMTAFSTMLTAAWANGAVQAHYGEELRLYTLGYNLSSSDVYAQNVLDPMNPNNTNYGLYKRWADTYLALDKGETATLSYGSGWNSESFAVRRQSEPSQVTTLDYVDQFWQASGTEGLKQAFASIADEIIIQSRYYSTLVTSDQHHQDGYISFTDEIGTHMQVKDVKGIYIGDGKLISGAMFSEFVTEGDISDYTGTGTDYTSAELQAFGAEILGAIATRFSISLTEARALIDAAIASGFIYYNSPSDFSNYMAWYADAESNYIAPYTGASAVPASGAKYIVRSYFYMGDVTQNHVETSMLYMLVRVREDIETGRQTVDMNLPAALLPMITYTVEVEGDTYTEDSILGMTCEQKKPVSLLYEVGTDSQINPFNLTEKMGYNATSYNIYTNRWTDDNYNAFVIPDPQDVNPHVFFHGLIHTTVAQYIPSLENERLYFLSTTPILVKDGENYVPYDGLAAPSGDGFYYEFKWIAYDSATQSYRMQSNFNVLNAVALEADHVERKSDNAWYVKRGTPKTYFVRGAMMKTENLTSTLAWSNTPQVVRHESADHTGYHMLSYLGNNGTLTLTPAQGIKLTKAVDTVLPEAPTEFTFTVSLTGDEVASSYSVRAERADGTVSTAQAPVSNGTLTVTLSAGDTVYITQIAEGTQYTVTEAYSPYYAASSSNASGTVAENTLHDVHFVNSPKGYGSLLVAKDVVHPFSGSDIPAALAAVSFSVTVTFDGDANDLKNIVDPNGVKNDAGNTEFTVSLTDGTSVLFTSIPEGVSYSVRETAIPNGFTLDSPSSGLSGEIAKDVQSEALLVNSYAPAPVSPDVTLVGTKTVVGDGYTGTDSFDVMLQQVVYGGNAFVNVGDPVAIGSVANGESYTFDLGNALNGYSFDKVGYYSFHVYEAEPATGAAANVSYDKTFAMFSVHVTDADVDGALEIGEVIVHQGTAALSGNAADGWTVDKDFTNAYLTEQLSFTVSKTVNGGADREHDSGIAFGLYTSTDAPSPVAIAVTDANGDATFYVNAFYKQTDVYYLREIRPLAEEGLPGMTYDTAWKYTVTVSWDEGEADPSLTATDASGAPVALDALTINNTYEEATVDFTLSGNKTLNGGALREKDSFAIRALRTDASFSEILGEKGLFVTAANPGYSFTFSFDAPGVYYLKVLEHPVNRDGITCDPAEYRVTLRVSNVYDGDKLTLKITRATVHKTGGQTVELDVTGDAVSFTQADFDNLYRINGSASVSVNGSKTLSGRTLLAGEFTFGLFVQGSNEPLYSAVNSVDGLFSFPTLTYTFSDLASLDETYVYEIREILPDGTDRKGVVYDETLYTLTVRLTDNGDGTVAKSVTLKKGNAAAETVNGDVSVSFENSYSASPTSLTLSGVKALTGKDLVAGAYTFNLYETGSDFIIADRNAPFKTATNAADGSYSISVDYDTKGYRYYVLTEAVPAETNGVLYDNIRYQITVNAVDNGHGELEVYVIDITAASHVGSWTKDTLNFNNRYQPAPVSLEISGTKTFDKTLTADLFEFVLRDENGVVSTVKNAADGTFAFPKIEFDKAGTYVFTVSETKGGSTEKGVSYDATVYTLTVVVKDNGNGNLYIDEDESSLRKTVGTETSDAAAIAFHNTYSTDVNDEIVLSGSKTLQNRPIVADEFTFELYHANASFEKGELAQTAKNAADGSFSFADALVFRAPGEYYYLISEKDLGADGITYDSTVYGVKITVTDNGEGKLIADVEYVKVGGSAADAVAFENVYAPKSVSDTLSGEKALEGRPLKQGEFSFDLFAADDRFNAVGDALETVTNAADGTFSFSALTFDEAGTFRYVIREQNTAAERVTYDGAVYRITYTVEKNAVSGDYQITSRVIQKDEATEAVTKISFVNVYDPKPVSDTLNGLKGLEGRAIAAEEFSFVLTAEDGTVLETVKNAADGTFAFSALTFDEAGTFRYLVRESAGNDIRITYDETVYEVTYVVEKNAESGDYQIASRTIVKTGSTAAEDGIAFRNVYTPKPEDIRVGLQIVKTVVNKGTMTLTPDGFRFPVLSVDGTAATELVTLVSDAQGNASYELLFTEEDIGKTYTYTVRENNDGREHVTYSTAEYTVTVTISLSEENVLLAAITVNGTAAESIVLPFENIYDFTPDNPGTSDGSFRLWLALGAVSLGATALTFALRKRRESEEN